MIRFLLKFRLKKNNYREKKSLFYVLLHLWYYVYNYVDNTKHIGLGNIIYLFIV